MGSIGVEGRVVEVTETLGEVVKVQGHGSRVQGCGWTRDAGEGDESAVL